VATGQSLAMLPWFVRYYIAATRQFSLAERGAYTDLLFLSWEIGPLPNDPIRLARLIGVSAPEFKRVWTTIRTKFTETEKGLVNTRLEQHRVESMDRSAKARSSAHLRWERARQYDGNANASTNAHADAHPNADATADANGHAKRMLPSPSPSPYTNPNPKSARTSGRDRGKPASAAELLAPAQNGKHAGEGEKTESTEAQTLKRIVLDELSRGVSAAAIIRLMPGRGLTEEQIAQIQQEAAS
jgi:uncharacterized protein YdaU (DUF1376 family)